MKPKPLSKELIKSNLTHNGIGNIHVFDVLDSSNTWALKHAQCGDVCLTEQQTAGRGRRGHIWHSPKQSNLYLSLKWCFDDTPMHFGLLSLMVAVVIADCLKREGLHDHGIKWPNDILYQGKKLGGILLETKGNLNHVVIGIGLNIDMQAAEIDQPWISLNRLLKTKVDRNLFTAKLLSALAERLARFPQLKVDDFIGEWKTWDILQGQQVNILSDNIKLSAQVIGINPQGNLVVTLPNGMQQTFLAADVSIKNSTRLIKDPLKQAP